ncbi:MAG: NAD(P)-dependent glycerol-3-phosphate dehydrogenase [Magnetococcales bacterium]|nr:NAD(P)-dependent glycerol-3-phosphate dehydrogenase [Magnetococcales bacterium]
MAKIMEKTSTAVIGAGSWGTALATVLASKLPRVTLWCHEPEVADGINRDARNPLFLPEFQLPGNIVATTDLLQTAREHAILVMVVPTQFTRGILGALRGSVTPETVFVSASKGVEAATMTLLSEIHVEILGAELGEKSCFLSGPSFARDTIMRLPAAVAIAGGDPERVERVQKLFHTPWFRTYSTEDVIGLELGGALKNVMALAAGISDGLGMGHSARAALITRGLNEMLRLGMKLGARPETFAGLSGLGDLLLTATSDLSRNRTVGVRIGRGETLESIQRGTHEIAEGVRTVEGVRRLAEKLDLDLPITRAVHGILYEGRAPLDAVRDLMERDLKPEHGGFEG